MTTREHLKGMHTKDAEHHVAAAKHHRTLAKLFGKMDIESAEDVAAAHEGLAQSHIAMSEFHLECCKGLDATHKAMGMDGGDALVPDFISSIAPDIPQHIRAIPRVGQPELALDKSAVSEQFQKLVSVDE
jgi:hypothetical protein